MKERNTYQGFRVQDVKVVETRRVKTSMAGGAQAGGVDSDGEGPMVKDGFHERDRQRMSVGVETLCV